MKIRVGVFFGGNSTEHEISIISALQALENFDRDVYDVLPIYITKNNLFYVGNDIGNIDKYKNISELLSTSTRVVPINNGNTLDLMIYPPKTFGQKIFATIDVAFPIVHGTNIEDGTLAGLFKMNSIPFVGSDVTASAVGMDKYVMKCVLKDNDVPVLDCILANKNEFETNEQKVLEKIKTKIGFPVIIKPINLGSSIGIKIAKNDSTLLEALKNAFMFSPQILAERAVTNLKEINISVLGDEDNQEVSECEEPVLSQDILSFEDKYMSGGSKKTGTDAGSKSGMASLSRKIPANITAEQLATVQKYAKETFKCLNCHGVVRIDFMIDQDQDKIYVNEINTIPGSLSFYLWKAKGVEYKDLLDKLIKLGLKRKRKQEDLTFSFESNVLSHVNIGGSKGGKM
ncbi:MAG: D-alanine--D-alanine ligase [Peptostreptococcaceae bacterium]|nr:D-alanine--D-alanine ligase [Peptostreptococcaceae bacterium]